MAWRSVLLVALLALIAAASGVLAADEPAPTTFGGVGLVISQERNDAGEMVIKVTGLTDDSAAGEAGIQVGDTITHIGGNAVAGLDFAEVVERLRGQPGTKVVLTVVRPGQNAPLDFEITRRGQPEPGGLAAERAQGIAQVAQAQVGPGGPMALVGMGGPGGRVQFFGPGGAGGAADMIATQTDVFVLRGDRLYRFRTEGLALAWETDLRTDEEKSLAERGINFGRGNAVAKLLLEGEYLYALRNYMLHQFRLSDMQQVAVMDLRTPEEKEQQAQMIQRIEQMRANPQQFQGGRGGRGGEGGGNVRRGDQP